MDVNRARGLLIAVAASTLVFAGCRGEGQAVPPRSSAPAAQDGDVAAAEPRPRVPAADLAAYARGRRREVALMRSALARLNRADGDSRSRRAAVSALAKESVEREGAVAAGLTSQSYHALVIRMDSVLLERSRTTAGVGREASANGGPDSLDEWRLLDSLRVELAVLRTRFAAAAAVEGDARP